MSKRVLITGGAGFIAHHAIKYYLENTDWEIVSLDRLDYSGNLNRISDLMNGYDEKQKKRIKIKLIGLIFFLIVEVIGEASFYFGPNFLKMTFYSCVKSLIDTG